MIILALIGVALVLSAGTCQLCKLFTAKDIARDASGVPHDEHNPFTGAVLTGWQLKAMQVIEAVFDPICSRVNKLLGRS